jgi:hypothetical protein
LEEAMNEQPKENPYASPEAPSDPVVESRIQSLKWLRGAAIGILFFAAFEFLSGLFWIIVAPIVFAATIFFPMQGQLPLWQSGLGWVAAIAVTVRAGFMFYGAWHMRTAKSYRWAMASAILSITGIVYPGLWLSIPFGVWAFILLRRKNIRAAFAESSPLSS